MDALCITVYVLGKFTALHHLAVGLGRGTLPPNGAGLTGLGLVLLEFVVPGLVPGLVRGQGVPLWTGIAVRPLVVYKVFCIVAGVWGLALF